MAGRKKRIKNITDVYIDTIGYGGVGIGKLENGKKVVVKGGALPGSVVDIHITRSRKDFVQGHITNIKSQSPDYTDGKIFCEHYMLNNIDQDNAHKVGCGGCKWQVMSYDKQLQLKQKIVEDSFKNTTVLPIIGTPKTKNYRNKIEFSFGKYITGKGEELKTLSDRSLGFHKQGEFSKIIDITSCGLISDKTNKIFEHIKQKLQQTQLPVYDQKTHIGFFRHLVIREGVNTGQVLINLVVANNYLRENNLHDKREKICQELKKDNYLTTNITSFDITYNDGLADTVKGPDIITKNLRGNGYIFEELKIKDTNIKFRISPFSFFQTNTTGAEILFSTAVSMLPETKGTVLDLYCGTGTIGISLLKLGIGNKLLGIEIVSEAVKDAFYNSELNNLSQKTNFISSPAEKAIQADNKYTDPIIQEDIDKLGLIVVDPPREGLHKDVIEFLLGLYKVKRYKLLYISCNPVTMARDIELLSTGGLNTSAIQPVDMFPQTHHIECISVLG